MHYHTLFALMPRLNTVMCLAYCWRQLVLDCLASALSSCLGLQVGGLREKGCDLQEKVCRQIHAAFAACGCWKADLQAIAKMAVAEWQHK